MLLSRHIWDALLVLSLGFTGLCAWSSYETQDLAYSAQDLGAPSGYAARLASTQDMNRDSHLIQDLVMWSHTDRRSAVDHRAQKTCLAEAVYYEARSETLAGQKAVAEVVMNRVKSRHYPNTVCGVVYEGSERRTGCQFSFTCDGSMDRAPYGKYWTRSQDVAALTLTDGFDPVTKRATHYHTTAVNPYWSKKLKKTDQYGTHVFYRFKTRKEQREGTSTISLAPPPS